VVGAFNRRVGGGKGIDVPSEKIRGLYSSGTLLAGSGAKGSKGALRIEWTRLHYATVLLDTSFTSSTAQGGGGSFKNRKPIGEVGYCESGMADRSH